MKKIELKAESRDSWEKLNQIRANKIIPWVIYGRKQEPLMIKVRNSDLMTIINKYWRTNIVSVNVWGKKIDSIIHDYQLDPVMWNYIHVDFYAITAWEKITTSIPLSFVWESEAQKSWSVIEERLKEIEVRCLIEDLVNSFDVDISSLKEDWDAIKVSDLWLDPEKYDILTSLDEVVASAYTPQENVIEEIVEEVAEGEEAAEWASDWEKSEDESSEEKWWEE